MKRLYNFKCQSGDIIERYTDNPELTTCECGKEAVKAPYANKSIFQVNGAGAYSNQMKGK